MSWQAVRAALLMLVLATAAAPVTALQDGDGAHSNAPGHRVLGYDVTYDPTSWASLEANAHLIDLVAVRWVTIDACGRLTSSDDQTLKRFARSRGIKVLPSLGTFSGWLNHRLLTDDETSARARAEIVDYVVAEGHDGLDLDLEGIRPEDRAVYTAFVARLGATLRERYRVPIALDPAMRSETMRYRAPSGEPPPVPVPPPTPEHEMTHRRPPACPVVEPPPAEAPPPTPKPTPDAIQEHEVWLEGAASAAARLPLADRYRAGGVALWRLGHEDQTLWTVVDRWRRGVP